MTTNSVPRITPPEAFQKLNADEAVLVDVRMAFDWAGGRVPGSLNLPNLSIKFRKNEVPNDKVLIFMGPNAARSNDAARAALSLGFESVYVLEEGFDAWVAAGLPSETMDG